VQVFENLTNNAVKFSPPSSQITISARLVDDLVQVDVSDEGIGIPPDERERIFEAFKQLRKGEPNASGVGLGLAICKGLIAAHGGQIWVQKKDSPGATISFTLPRAH
jgi:signal transduction histidine kinase